MSRVQILIVDDNVHMRRLLRTILGSFGCESVFEAGDAQSAIHQFNATEFDVVITDYLMEPVDGLDLIRALRDRDTSPNPFVPIIMITGCANRDSVAAARDAGVTEFLAKPLSAAALYKRLHMIVDRPRPFIRAKSYFGPDRRRTVGKLYEGPERRDEPGASKGAGA